MDLNLQDSKVQTPLHLAALFGNENAVKQLLCHSAVDANIKDNKGGTPLIATIRFSQEAVCKALIESTKVSIIEPNPKTDKTPLHIAALHSSAARTVKMLLQRQETLPSVRDRGNRTALQRAYEINNAAVVRVTLESHRVDAILEPWGPGDDAVSESFRGRLRHY
jgi:ankyrin repeat protein